MPVEGTPCAQLINIINMKEKVGTKGIMIDKINKTDDGNVQIKIKGMNKRPNYNLGKHYLKI